MPQHLYDLRTQHAARTEWLPRAGGASPEGVSTAQLRVLTSSTRTIMLSSRGVAPLACKTVDSQASA